MYIGERTGLEGELTGGISSSSPYPVVRISIDLITTHLR